MKIRKNGIYKTIDPSDFGIYQKAGFEKVVTEPFKKLEEVAEEPINVEKPIKEVAEEELVEDETIDELPKSKKKRK